METVAPPMVVRHSNLDRLEMGITGLKARRRKRLLILVLVTRRTKVGHQGAHIQERLVRHVPFIPRIIRGPAHDLITRTMAMDTLITHGVLEIRGDSVSSSLGTRATSAACIITASLLAGICLGYI
jgi:hypothetical protein